MTLETAIIFIVSVILLWIKPGPGQTLRVTIALQSGFISAFTVTMGVSLVCLGYFLVVAIGYSTISESFGLAAFVFKILGAFYLLYLGYRSIQQQFSSKGTAAEQAKITKQDKPLRYFFMGVLMALSNPITIFYFVGILPALVPVGVMSMEDIVIGMALLFFFGAASDGLLLWLVVLAKSGFSESAVFKYLNLFAGISFILIAVFLFYTALFVDDFSFNML